MDFSLTEEQTEVQNLARKILEDLSTHDRLNQIESSDEGIDRELWAELARSNLLGVCLPESFGGSNLGFFTLCVLLEEVGRVVAAIPAIPTLVLGALPVSRFGSEEQKRRLLAGVAQGETLLTGALHEAGSEEPARPTTTAARDGDRWRLDGVKICVPAAHVADRILVPASSDDGGVALFLLDPTTEGVRLTPQQTTNRERHSQLELSGASVAETDVLVGPEQGAEAVAWLTNRATVAHCALQLGVSDKALHMTADYSKTREQFDRPIGSFQAVHTRAADAFIDVEAMRLTTWLAAWRLGEELPATEEVAVAKYWAAEGGQFVGYAAQHLHGGIGIDVDYPLHRYYLWAKQNELVFGSAAVQIARLGAQMAEAPIGRD
ncbi:MAG: acyl-CoA dehydrogenase family protein [Myxococcota bacterium]